MGSFESNADHERQRRGLNADDYPNKGNHIAIFECQLKQPPMLSLLNHTHFAFLMASRINFTNWRLVDVDNYMGGGKPFRTAEALVEGGADDPRVKYQARLERVMGTEEARAEKIEVRTSREREAFKSRIQEHITWLD